MVQNQITESRDAPIISWQSVSFCR